MSKKGNAREPDNLVSTRQIDPGEHKHHTVKLQPGIRMSRCWNAIQNCLGKSLPNELEYIVAALLFSGAQKGASPQKFALGKNTDQTSGTYTSVRQDKKPRKGENLSSSDNNS